MDYFSTSLKKHAEWKGKLSINSKIKLSSLKNLSLAYTPGVAAPSKAIAKNPKKLFNYTMKNNCVAVITDGSAVLGLGNIGAEASLPVMEGKCILFKEFAGIDSFPIALKTQNTKEIVSIIKNISPIFGGINLEDISAPRCFEIEQKLSPLKIPVFHDDQHGTAVIVLAALINALKVANKKFSESKIVVNGMGAAGTAISKMILSYKKPKEMVLCDKKGILFPKQKGILPHQKKLAEKVNKKNTKGTLAKALCDADVFIGVSAPGIVSKEMVSSMNKKPILFTLSNPIPEIMPSEAKKAGAFIVATGRSDFPNQVNNVLAFPGIFRGALDAKATCINKEMKLAAVLALSKAVKKPSREKIIPSPLDKTVVPKIALAVKKTAKSSGVVRNV